MPGPIKWSIILDDQISGPAKQAASALDEMNGNLSSTGSAFSSLSTSSSDAGFSLSNLAIKFDSIVYAGRQAWDVIHGVGDAVYGLGSKIVDAVSTKQNFGMAMEGLLGSADAANAAISQVSEFAKHSPFKTEEVMGWYNQLALVGFKAGEIGTLLEGVGDSAVLNRLQPGAGQAFVDVMARIQTTGMLASRELVRVGITEQEFFKQLPDAAGKSMYELRDELSRMKWTPPELEHGILAALAAKEKGKGLGALTDRAAGSLTGLLTRLQGDWYDFFSNTGNDGMSAFQSSLANVVSVLDPDSPEGRDLMQRVGGLFKDIFGDLSGASGKEKIKGFFDDLIAKAGEFIDKFRQAWPEIKAFFEKAFGAAEKFVELVAAHPYLAAGGALALATGGGGGLLGGLAGGFGGGLLKTGAKGLLGLVAANPIAAMGVVGAGGALYAAHEIYEKHEHAIETPEQHEFGAALAAHGNYVTPAHDLIEGVQMQPIVLPPNLAGQSKKGDQYITLNVSGGINVTSPSPKPEDHAVAVLDGIHRHIANQFDHINAETGGAP